MQVSQITQNIIHRFLLAIMTNLPAIFGSAGNHFLPANCRQIPYLIGTWLYREHNFALNHTFSIADLKVIHRDLTKDGWYRAKTTARHHILLLAVLTDIHRDFSYFSVSYFISKMRKKFYYIFSLKDKVNNQLQN